MQVTEFARSYCEKKGLAKTPVSSANRFAKLIGDMPICEITQQHVEQFLIAAKSAGFSADTIRGTVKDLKTLMRAHGESLEIRVTCQRSIPDPKPTPLAHLAAIVPYLAPWSMQWLVLSYWTALRLADVIQLQQTIQPTDVLRYQASKTRWRHVWPMPKWIQPYLQPVRLPYKSCGDWAQVIVRGELERCSMVAKVPRVTPKNVRQRALTEWSMADSAAGAIVHGHTLKILDHYVDHLAILQRAMSRVQLPAGFRTEEQNSAEESLVVHFRKLDPEVQNLVVSTTQRLAGA